MNNPTHEELMEFYNSCCCLFSEGVEFMTKLEIYGAIKKDCLELGKE